MVSPLFYLMAAAMLIMAVISFRYNRILFAIELTVSVLAICAVVVSDILMKQNIAVGMKRARRVLSAEDDSALDDFPLPVVLVSDKEDIIWGNEAFRRTMGADGEFMGDSIQKIIHPKTLRQIMGEPGIPTSYKDRDYTVYGVKSGSNCILYFIDDTEYKAIAKENREKKMVVCLAVFDNQEEIARVSMGGEESRITAGVEAVLRDWATDSMNGFMLKLRNDKYLVITDEKSIEEAKKKRFEILDKVREIKGGGKMSATISIGVGRMADSASDSERKARQALDMALGRGGDQVAVMQKGDAFEFFGGLSKGVEKRDKVRTRVISAAISDLIMASDHVFVMGHKNSDLDSVGAAVGMWAVAAKGLEKPASIVVNKEQTLATKLIESVEEAYPETEIFIEPSTALQRLSDNSLVIIVDTHSIDFVENRDLVELAEKVIIIDHHRMMVSHIRNAQIFYHEPYASSASEMVAEIVQYIKSTAIEAVEAQALLAGISLDTKNYVVKTGVRTFEASAYLRRRGADTVEVKRLFSNSLDAYKEKSQLVQSAEIYMGCAIAVSSWGDEEDIRVAAAQAADELLSIQGVKASFVLYRFNGGVNISARSLGDVNVQVLLEAFGGGGHFTMAGAQIKDTNIAQARRMLINELDEKLDKVTAQN